MTTNDQKLDVAKDFEQALGLVSELHDIGDLGRMRQGHVAGDGNCLWRALAKAWRAAGHGKHSWKNLKKQRLQLKDGDVHENHIRAFRVHSCWGENAAICLAASRLNCKISVYTDVQVAFYAVINAKSMLAIRFNQHHFSPLYPVDDNETKRGQGMMSSQGDS